MNQISVACAPLKTHSSPPKFLESKYLKFVIKGKKKIHHEAYDRLKKKKKGSVFGDNGMRGHCNFIFSVCRHIEVYKNTPPVFCFLFWFTSTFKLTTEQWGHWTNYLLW